MQEVGLAINFEAMGTQGASEVFDSSPQDGWLATEFLKAAPYPLGNSSIVNLFKAVPATQMGMDLQEYLDRGSAGLDFVYTGDLPAYHTMRDNVHLIDARSIQHDGSYALCRWYSISVVWISPKYPQRPTRSTSTSCLGALSTIPRPWLFRWRGW